jgi:hypothetical protein
MRCHELAKSANFADLSLPVSGLYLLAAPSTPTAQDLFAFPAQSHGSAGLAWRINGDRLVELHRDWALVEAPGTGNCRVLNRQLPAR